MAHWHRTQAHCSSQIQNCITLFSGGTLAHNFRSTVLLEFKTVCLCFWVAHWHTTQVHCTAQIQNCISFFSGGTLAHDSSILFKSNSKQHLFVFGWHTDTQLKSTVLLKFKTASLCFHVAHWHTTLKSIVVLKFKTITLCFLVAHWHTTQVHCSSRIQNCISLFSDGTLHWHTTQAHCSAQIQNCLALFFGGTLSHKFKSTVLLEFKNASLCFWVAH
jgi:hypothetical protein